MYTRTDLSKLAVSATVRRKLTSYSEFGEKGCDIVFRTPFYALPSPSYQTQPHTRISGVSGVVPPPYDAILSVFIDHILEGVKGFPNIYKFEESFRKYAGSSRSIILPGKDRKIKLLQSFELQDKPLAVLSDSTKAQCLNRAYTRLRGYIHKYIPVKSIRIGANTDKIIQRMKKNTNGGMPLLKKGTITDPVSGRVLEDNTGEYVQLALKMISIINETGGRSLPVSGRSFIALNRTQEGADNQVKNRIVGGDAHACTIIAGALYPLLDACRRLPTRTILNGLDNTDEQLSYVVRHNKSVILSADQSAFDNHINYKIFKAYILPIIMECLNFDDALDWKLPVYEYLNTHVFCDPIITPDGLYSGVHGMSSGVLVVNEVDSGYLLLLAMYLDEIDHCNCVPVAVQGDDAVFTVDLPIDNVATWFESRCADLNLEANALKQGVAKDSCTFIKRLGTTETEHGYRSKIGSTIGLLNEENAKSWNEYMYEARAGAILSNHYLTDPAINDFFGQVTLGGKYRIGLDLPNGYYDVIKLAGGEHVVSSQLKLDSYSNMRGVSSVGGVGTLSIANLAIMRGQEVAKLESVPDKGFDPNLEVNHSHSLALTGNARHMARRRANKKAKKHMFD